MLAEKIKIFKEKVSNEVLINNYGIIIVEVERPLKNSSAYIFDCLLFAQPEVLTNLQKKLGGKFTSYPSGRRVALLLKNITAEEVKNKLLDI